MDPHPLLRKYDIRPRRSLGQNFLVDPAALRSVVEAAELNPEDAVLEIGPGAGALTTELVERAGCVLAVELDPKLVALLQAELAGAHNLHVVQGDILKLAPTQELRVRCPCSPVLKVVANLPYYITSHALRRLMEAQPGPELIVTMVQKEVAQRAAASPPDMSLLAVAAQYYALPEVVAIVPAGAFTPQPEVDSAVLRLRMRAERPFPELPTETFFHVAAAGFGQKRKSLVNSLSSNLGIPKGEVAEALERAGAAPMARAQELSLEEWSRVCAALSTR